jgi:hypothetical protein
MLGATEDDRRTARRNLNTMLDRLVVEHQKFNTEGISNDEARIAYVARWLICNELEEFLGERVEELAPDDDDMHRYDHSVGEKAA